MIMLAKLQSIIAFRIFFYSEYFSGLIQSKCKPTHRKQIIQPPA